MKSHHDMWSWHACVLLWEIDYIAIDFDASVHMIQVCACMCVIIYLWMWVQPIADEVAQHLEIISKLFQRTSKLFQQNRILPMGFTISKK